MAPPMAAADGWDSETDRDTYVRVPTHEYELEQTIQEVHDGRECDCNLGRKESCEGRKEERPEPEAGVEGQKGGAEGDGADNGEVHPVPILYDWGQYMITPTPTAYIGSPTPLSYREFRLIDCGHLAGREFNVRHRGRVDRVFSRSGPQG